jgi:hypothetical protein
VPSLIGKLHRDSGISLASTRNWRVVGTHGVKRLGDSVHNCGLLIKTLPSEPQESKHSGIRASEPFQLVCETTSAREQQQGLPYRKFASLSIVLHDLSRFFSTSASKKIVRAL